MPYTLEICCDSIQSALYAQEAGADRIELCDNLKEGGTTPSAAKIKLLKQYLTIPVAVLIRPRPGDFCYAPHEMEVMLENIHIAKSFGADVIVSGALTEKMDIHIEQTTRLIEAAKPLPFVFHKAYDMCRRPMEALEQLVQMGVERILTSGQKATALEGMLLLKELVAAANGRIEIMAGGGVRPANLSAILQVPGLCDIHSAAKKWHYSSVQENESWYEVDKKMVEEMKLLLSRG